MRLFRAWHSGDPNRQPISRPAADRLRALELARQRAEAELIGAVAALAAEHDIAPERVAGFDDGDRPALLLGPPPE